MKILMPTSNSMGTQVLNDKGDQITGITRVVVTADIGQLVVAEIHLMHINTTQIEDATPVFLVGAHRDVTGLILADGRKIDLATGDEIDAG